MAIGVKPVRLKVSLPLPKVRSPVTVTIALLRLGREITAPLFQLSALSERDELTTNMPLLSVTAPVPSAAALVVTIVPALRVVPPLKLLLPESIVVPVPETVRVLLPITAPLSAKVALLLRVVLVARFSVVVMVFDPSRLFNVPAACMVNVPVPKRV